MLRNVSLCRGHEPCHDRQHGYHVPGLLCGHGRQLGQFCCKRFVMRPRTPCLSILVLGIALVTCKVQGKHVVHTVCMYGLSLYAKVRR